MSLTDGKVSVGWKSFHFHFHNFADLGKTKGNYVKSPEFTCNGRQWQLEVYPRGDEEAKEGYVSAYLRHLSEGTITVTYRIAFMDTIMDEFGKSSAASSSCNEFSSRSTWGWSDYVTRHYIRSQDILNSGTLTIVVSMKEDTTSVFVPKNPLLEMMKEMFNDETTSDVCFEVVNDAGNGNRNSEREGDESKTPVSFHAHRSILTKCAPMLADLLGSNDTATITDVKPDVFHHLLYYVYGGEIAEEDLEYHGKDIIDAADKYSIVNLKLAAEAAYVESTDVTFDNAIDDLLYADSKNCALLKEQVMQFLADNHLEAAEKVSFTECPGHVMKDLLIAVGRNSKKNSIDANADDLTTLSVDKLRRKLAKLGLEVDGSREAMIESIKAHSAS